MTGPFLAAGEAGKGNVEFLSFMVESRKAKVGLGTVLKQPNIAVCHENSILKKHWGYKIFNNVDGLHNSQSEERMALNSWLDRSGGCRFRISLDYIQIPKNISEILTRMFMSTL